MVADMDVHGAVCVVTGAAGGMGRHIAGRLHADGHRVLLTDIAVADLPPFYRQKVGDTLSASGKTAAIRIVENLRAEMVKCQTGTGGSGCTS